MTHEPGRREIGQVLIHPVFDRAFVISEHAAGELEWLGDVLGCDGAMVCFVDGWTRRYAGDGTRNEDWYGWGAPVLAPIDGVVERVHVNPVTNQPGSHADTRGSSIAFLRDDGVRVMLGHVGDISVADGDRVTAGQEVAKVGNNGYSWYPHIHAGAWLGETPLQIRFDVEGQGRLLARDPTAYWGGRIAPKSATD